MKKLTCHCNVVEAEINISGNLDKEATKKLLKKIVPDAVLEKIPNGFRPEDIEPKLGMLLSKSSNIK